MFGIPLPYIALAICIALFGSYRGGYHFGWQDRDNDMKIAIAQKNDEARAKEKEFQKEFNKDLNKARNAQFWCFAIAGVIAYFLVWGYK